MVNPTIRTVSCGCCTNGCCCFMHRDEPNGRPVKVCEYHADPAHPHPRTTTPIETFDPDRCTCAACNPQRG